MNDELECFREAAKMGCPDFAWTGYWVLFTFGEESLPMIQWTTKDCKRINRYAGAVCAMWWHKQMKNYPPWANHYHLYKGYKNQALAFAEKHGDA